MRLHQLDILQHRFDLHTYPKLEEAHGRELAGYLGENSLPYYVNLLSLGTHHDLYGLRLELAKQFFQIDGLILHENLIVILEVKHYKGTLAINNARQLLQYIDQEPIVYDHPLLQANLQKEQLRSLLHLHKFPQIPIHTLVIFTHPKVNLSFSLEEEPDMLPVQQLPFKLQQLFSKHPKKAWNCNQLAAATKKLLKLHRPATANVLEEFKLSPRQIRQGIFCPTCKPHVLQRIYGNWYCDKCKQKYPLAYHEALREFAHLFGPTINNKQARWFFRLESPSTTSRLLSAMNLNSRNACKNRSYDLTPLIK